MIIAHQQSAPRAMLNLPLNSSCSAVHSHLGTEAIAEKRNSLHLRPRPKMLPGLISLATGSYHRHKQKTPALPKGARAFCLNKVSKPTGRNRGCSWHPGSGRSVGFHAATHVEIEASEKNDQDGGKPNHGAQRSLSGNDIGFSAGNSRSLGGFRRIV